MEDSFYLVPQCPSAMSTKNVNLLLRACDLYGQFPPGPLFGLMCYGHHLEVLINFFNKEPIFLQCPQNVCSQTYPSLIKAHVPLEKVRWTSLCLLPCFSLVALGSRFNSSRGSSPPRLGLPWPHISSFKDTFPAHPHK